MDNFVGDMDIADILFLQEAGNNGMIESVRDFRNGG